jgi:hypothetical protein
MGNILRSPQTSNGILLTPRSGSHSLSVAALKHFWPHIVIITDDGHPAGQFPVQETYTGTQNDLAIVVRNPIERFRSIIAHKHLDVEGQLVQPMYGTLPQGNFVRYFRFEDQLNDAAEWLGLPTPLPHIDSSLESDKPNLTPEQEARVRKIYADDIVLWESLQ